MKSPTDRPETYSPRPWGSPEAQRLFGLALVKSGQKHQDREMIALGRSNQAVAASASRDQASMPGGGDTAPSTRFPDLNMRLTPRTI